MCSDFVSDSIQRRHFFLLTKEMRADGFLKTKMYEMATIFTVWFILWIIEKCLQMWAMNMKVPLRVYKLLNRHYSRSATSDFDF